MSCITVTLGILFYYHCIVKYLGSFILWSAACLTTACLEDLINLKPKECKVEFETFLSVLVQTFLDRSLHCEQVSIVLSNFFTSINMAKCTRCNKIISKKSIGLECNKCSSVNHASTSCTEFTAMQAALQCTEFTAMQTALLQATENQAISAQLNHLNNARL